MKTHHLGDLLLTPMLSLLLYTLHWAVYTTLRLHAPEHCSQLCS